MLFHILHAQAVYISLHMCLTTRTGWVCVCITACTGCVYPRVYLRLCVTTSTGCVYFRLFNSQTLLDVCHQLGVIVTQTPLSCSTQQTRISDTALQNHTAAIQRNRITQQRYSATASRSSDTAQQDHTAAIQRNKMTQSSDTELQDHTAAIQCDEMYYRSQDIQTQQRYSATGSHSSPQ